MSLCIGECNLVGVVGDFGVLILVIAALVVSLKILLNFSNAWICVDGSLAFHLLA